MKFVADEGVDGAIVQTLRGIGHEVFYVAEAAPGLTDDEVLELANSRNAILLTADKDFGELVFRLGQVHTGVVLLRLMGLASALQAQIVVEVVERHGAQMKRTFTVVTPKMVRIRPHTPS